MFSAMTSQELPLGLLCPMCQIMSTFRHLEVEPLGRAEAEAEAASDSMQRDERRLAELGRRAVEMYVMSHIFLEKIAVSLLCSLQCQRAGPDAGAEHSKVHAHSVQPGAQHELLSIGSDGPERWTHDCCRQRSARRSRSGGRRR